MKKIQQIVSLVPSISELVFDLGLGEQLVGRTKYCIHPAEIRQISQIGGTKNIDIQRILLLKPDVVLASKEENTKNQILSLQKKTSVYITDSRNYEDALEMISEIGDLLGKTDTAQNLVEEIIRAFASIPVCPQRKALYLIWRNPYMTIGKNTYINSMLQKAGFVNLCSHLAGNYPVLDESVLDKLKPEVILLSSEPYKFRDVHAQEIAQLFPSAKICFVDGEMFSWYGSRMLKAAEYFKNQEY